MRAVSAFWMMRDAWIRCLREQKREQAVYALTAVLRLQGVWRSEGRSTRRRREYGAGEATATDQLGPV